MKNKYRLQPVLEMREQARREAAQAVAARREQLAAAEATLRECQHRLDQHHLRLTTARDRLASPTAHGLKASELLGSRRHIADLQQQEENLTHQLQQQQETVAQAEADLERALSALSEASKQLQAIEKHRENWQQRMRQAAERRDQKLLDEIASTSS